MIWTMLWRALWLLWNRQCKDREVKPGEICKRTRYQSVAKMIDQFPEALLKAVRVSLGLQWI